MPEVKEGIVATDYEGTLDKDGFGRVYIDKCESTEQHLTKPPIWMAADRPACRKYLDDVLPEHLLGKRIRLSIKIHYEVTNDE